MPVNYLFSTMCIFDGLFAIVAAIAFLSSKREKSRLHFYVIAMCIASAIWSIGFGCFYIQTDFHLAHIFKSIAIFGTFSYMILAQVILNRISGIGRKYIVYSTIVAFSGIPIYFLSLLPGQTVYYFSNMGITYYFKPGLISMLYTSYFALVSANMLVNVLYMLFQKNVKRIRVYGTRFLLVLIVSILGTVFDMVFPAIGMPAVPGSNVTQFWGLMIVCLAIRAVDRNRIDAMNMTEYIYSAFLAPFLVIDNSGRVQLMNDAGLAFFKLDGKKGEHKNAFFDDLFDFAHDQKSYTEADEMEVYDRAEYRKCLLTINKINDEYGDKLGYVIMVRDISERMRYIEELRRAREEADLSNKAKTTFLANMSHEIRTPMNAIIGFSEIILKQNLDIEQIKDYAENIRDSSYGLLDLINDILDITKIESGKVSLNNADYSLKGLIENVLTQIRPLADKKKLELKYEIDSQAPTGVFGDEGKIREILINLMNNAVKYTASGSVCLKLAAQIDENAENAELTFDVVDTGCGIRKEEQNTVFEAFEQVNKKLHAGIEGTGLGLAIVKGYAEIMGANIGVRSEFGKGSDFFLQISQKITDKKPIGRIGDKKQEKRSSIGELRFDGVRVLVVDDNLINLKVSSKTMECYGLIADVAESGPKSIEMCRNTNYPIVFMDQMMPGMDGVEAMQHIREISDYYRHEAKIVALTANALTESRDMLLGAGFNNYLKKPMEFDQLEKTLTEYLKKD